MPRLRILDSDEWLFSSMVKSGKLPNVSKETTTGHVQPAVCQWRWEIAESCVTLAKHSSPGLTLPALDSLWWQQSMKGALVPPPHPALEPHCSRPQQGKVPLSCSNLCLCQSTLISSKELNGHLPLLALHLFLWIWVQKNKQILAVPLMQSGSLQLEGSRASKEM